MNERPLLTFAVSAYNQERFIRGAVEGAFNQMYSPLEIILSDDCSSDETFAIMGEMASNYRGPHRIILNRNQSNLGFCGHINRIMQLTSGALVIIAQGDDISLPERTSLIHQAWEYSGRSVTSIYSDYFLIDKSGDLYSSLESEGEEKNSSLFELQHGDLREFMHTMRPLVSGCTHAWSRYLFNRFGQLPVNLRWCEDFLLTFRSLAINGILRINRPLVKYRRHDENFSFHAADAALVRKSHLENDYKRRVALHQLVTAYDVIARDIESLRRMSSHDGQYLDGVAQEARQVRELYTLELHMMSENLPSRLCTLFDALFHKGPQVVLRLAPQILPRNLYHKLRGLKRQC